MYYNKSTFGAIIFLILFLILFVYQKCIYPPPIHTIPKSNENLHSEMKIQAELDDRFRFTTLHYDPHAITELSNELSKKLASTLNGHHHFDRDTKLIEFIEFWHDSYLPRWNERELLINSLPHYVTNIQGNYSLDIHFIYSKPSDKHFKNKTVIPVLLLHGWPGSISQYYEFIRTLTKSTNNDKTSNYIFEIIAPCLPGYGWSQSHIKSNNSNLYDPIHIANIAIALLKLMHNIGHDKFVIQSGDWGSIVGATLSTLFPENVLAYHSSLCVSISPLSAMKWIVNDFWLTIKDRVQEKLLIKANQNIIKNRSENSNSTVLVNSVDLVANILETIIQHFPNYSYDALLDNIMIYGLTNSNSETLKFDSDSIFYHQHKHHELLAQIPNIVPVGCAKFCHESLSTHNVVWKLKEKLINLMKSTWYLDGDHFDSWDSPIELLYDNFLLFIDKVFSDKNKKY